MRKNGIHWLSNNGVEAIVEVVEQCTAVIMVVDCLDGREMQCTLYCSMLTKTLLQTKQQFSGAVEMSESFIYPNELNNYPLRDTNSLVTFSINRIAKALSERNEVLTSKKDTEQEMIEVNELLFFEPFIITCLTPEQLLILFNEAKADLEVPDAFLSDCAHNCHPNANRLKMILIPLELEGEFVGAVKQCRDQYSKDPVHKCFQVFRTWKKSTETPT